MGYAFISYSTKNQTKADAINELFKRNNIDTWMAPYDIPAGSKYAAVITSAIRECSCFVLLLSNDSQLSEAVDSEVELAALTFKRPIIPIELENVVLNDSFVFYLHNKQITPIHKIDENSNEIKSVINSVTAFAGQTSNESNHVVKTTETLVFKESISDELNNKEDGNHSHVDAVKSSDELYKETTDNEYTEIDEVQINDIPKVAKNDEKGTNYMELLHQFEEKPIVDVLVPNSKEQDVETEKPKQKGRLISSYRRIIKTNKTTFNNPVEILLPDCSLAVFELCDEFEINGKKKYIVVKQIDENNEVLFFIFRNQNGKKTLITEGGDQNKVYHLFIEKHRNEYDFIDEKVQKKATKKKKYFASDTALKYFSSADDIPEILSIPDKYSYVSSNAFSKLNPNNKEIKQIILSDKILELGDNAFSGLIVTEMICIPKTVRYIGKNAFALKFGAFVYCEENSKALEYCRANRINYFIDEPFDTDSIERNEQSTLLDILSNKKFITRIKKFKSTSYEVDQVIIPSTVIIIDNLAFNNIKIMKKITVPDSVIQIGKWAFNLDENAYIECSPKSYAYNYCKRNNINNSVDLYRDKGVCQYCGAKFSGLFKKKCSECGREKDY